MAQALARGYHPRSRATEELEGAVELMDYIQDILEKLKEWGRRIVEALLGGAEPEVEAEPIPIPVDEGYYRRR